MGRSLELRAPLFFAGIFSLCLAAGCGPPSGRTVVLHESDGTEAVDFDDGGDGGGEVVYEDEPSGHTCCEILPDEPAWEDEPEEPPWREEPPEYDDPPWPGDDPAPPEDPFEGDDYVDDFDDFIDEDF